MHAHIFAPTWRHNLVLRIFWLFPQIQMVALCNSRAIGGMTNDEGRMTNSPNSKSTTNSDIDLFIITKCGNLWTGRFITTIITSLFGVRRGNTHGLQKGSEEYIRRTKDKYCLSFFVTEEHLDLGDICLQPADPYLYLWIRTLVPIIDKGGTFERFQKTNSTLLSSSCDSELVELETWGSIRESGDGFPPSREGRKREGCPGSLLSSLFSLLSIFENCIKYCWLPHTLRTYERLGRPWGVVISDTMLKFHDKDIRRDFIITEPY